MRYFPSTTHHPNKGISMSLNESVRLENLAPGIAQIVIDRPERHNAMTLDMYQALLSCINSCQQHSSVRAILFKGSGGKSFISGTDISYFEHFQKGEEGIVYEEFVEKVIDAVERIPVPTIAVIEGWAVGGGLALATACDFRICSDGSNFGAPIAKTLSNTLSSKNIARLVSALGVPRVKRILLLAEYLSAQEATASGFVHATYPSAELNSAALELASKLIKLSPITQEAVKESIRRIVVDQSTEDEDLIKKVYGSQAFRDGVAKFLKK